MQNQEIEIAILQDGRIEYTIKGVKGALCQDVSALLEQLGKVEHEEQTGEFYADDSQVDVTIAGA